MAGTKKVAVVTGANRGIGFETCRQLAKHGMKVVLTSRDKEKGGAAAERLRSEGLDVDFLPLDVSDDLSVQEFARQIKKTYGRVDVLVNNAGIMIDGKIRDTEAGTGVMQAKVETLRLTMEVNVYGALRVTQALLPLMPKDGARIVNVSSGMGQLSDMNGGWPGYRISKTGLNALTRIFADELKQTGIRVNSICPGWVKTDMGGAGATRSPQQGADTIVWLATAPDVPTGGFFRDRKPIPW
ncbi:MAG TPA: SDR family oxidoreductase [Candidatus Dormibacteraeota bacterium]|nr:SDR family oxidoreductase [Candidatus Dormibacteraeota bacterium]